MRIHYENSLRHKITFELLLILTSVLYLNVQISLHDWTLDNSYEGPMMDPAAEGHEMPSLHWQLFWFHPNKKCGDSQIMFYYIFNRKFTYVAVPLLNTEIVVIEFQLTEENSWTFFNSDLDFDIFPPSLVIVGSISPVLQLLRNLTRFQLFHKFWRLPVSILPPFYCWHK